MDAKRLLIVDDEPDFRALVATVGRQRGWTVSEHSTGREMIAKMEQDDAVDAIVLDIVMPDMDGIEAIRALSELARDVAVLIVTGRSVLYGNMARQIGTVSGVNVVGVLSKPVSMDELGAHLDACDRTARG